MAVAASAIGAGASLLSGITGGKGAQKAAQTQAAAYQKGIDEQHNEFAQQQTNFAPYLNAGTGALSSVLNLLGQNGNDAQGTAINALQASPLYQSQLKQDYDASAQNAAATGGLRGGNQQAAFANIGSNQLMTTIQNQLSNLGGIVNNGLGATNNLGQLGQNSADSIAKLLSQQGTAQAGGVYGQTSALQGIINSLGSFGRQAVAINPNTKQPAGIGW